MQPTLRIQIVDLDKRGSETKERCRLCIGAGVDDVVASENTGRYKQGTNNGTTVDGFLRQHEHRMVEHRYQRRKRNPEGTTEPNHENSWTRRERRERVQNTQRSEESSRGVRSKIRPNQNY